MKVDQCQPHENFWTARKSSQVVNWVKTKPRLAGNQIPFGGTIFGFTCVGVFNRGYPTSIKFIDIYTKSNLVPLKGIRYPANLGLGLTQLTTWDDWRAVQNFSWGWHWSTFKNIGC